MESKKYIEKGDVVKSLDFVGVSNCYFVGLVDSVNYQNNTFRAKTIKRVWEGKVDSDSPIDFFVAPLPGCHFFDDMAEEKGSEPRIQVVA